MRFPVTITQMDVGTWVAQHSSREVGDVQTNAPTREGALAKIEGEIRYRLELCPCTGETYQHITIEVVDSP